MSSGHYCDNCHQNQYNCTCNEASLSMGMPSEVHDFLNGWRNTIQRVFSSEATRSNTRVPLPSKESYGLPFDPHSAGVLATPNVVTVNAMQEATALIRRRMREQPNRFTDINRSNIEHLGPDLSGMPDRYPRKKVVGPEQPLKYGWNCVDKFKPPSGKLQFYTIGGTCIFSEYSTLSEGFATHWSYLLPSPSKQAGRIK